MVKKAEINNHIDPGQRRLSVGADVLAGAQGVHFRVWAPDKQGLELVVEGGCGDALADLPATFRMEKDVDGYFNYYLRQGCNGLLYRFRIDGSEELYPDPASRFQPKGPFGPSQVVDPTIYKWQDEGWKGMKMKGQVIYEMHIGTFTKQGTWRAAAGQLPQLDSLGITSVEILPVSDFVGSFGWGYDGVNMFAPTRLYGSPDDFRAFVDKAHKLGIGVILDVVYNHFGPEGNFMLNFSDYYLTEKKETEWGAAINFYGDNSGAVREYYLANAEYLIKEFHLDGLRFDAIQSIFDESEKHIITELVETIHKSAAGRSVITIAENEQQQTFMIRQPDKGGYGIDGMWNEDFHHTSIVAVTGKKEAYFTDHNGSPQEFISLAKHGFLFQGQLYKWQRFPRGMPALDIQPYKFVNYLQNHDQVANSGRGWRLNLFTSPGRYRALSAYFILGPGTPMIFQGQEYAASTPFHYFVDMSLELSEVIWEGRKKFLKQFRNLATAEYQSVIQNPSDPEIFESSKLDFSDRDKNRPVYNMYKDLISLKKEDPAFCRQQKGSCDGAVLGPEAFLLRFFCDEGDRLLLVNFGVDLNLNLAPEPLLAPPQNCKWQLLWSSENPEYGGLGTPPVFSVIKNVIVPGNAAVVFYPVSKE